MSRSAARSCPATASIPKQPQTLYEVPKPAVLVKLLNKWQTQRKSARVLLVLDVSGSMKDPADPDNPDGPTKLDLAKKAAIEALDQFKPEDEVGLRIFTTGLGPDQDQDYLDLLPIEPIGPKREALAARIRDQFPLNATPLYSVTQQSYEAVQAQLRPDPHQRRRAAHRRHERRRQPRRRQSTTAAGAVHAAPWQRGRERRSRSGSSRSPTAATPTSTRCARSPRRPTRAVYDASDPKTITKVFTAVVSNF